VRAFNPRSGTEVPQRAVVVVDDLAGGRPALTEPSGPVSEGSAEVAAMIAGRGLSRMQTFMLLTLYQWHLARRYDKIWGLPWRTTGTRSEQASMSRSLRRLEERGLVLRQNERTGNIDGRPRLDPLGVLSTSEWCRRDKDDGRVARTDHVQILPAGIALAERLTKVEGKLLTV